MEYVDSHINIPVPHIYNRSAHAEDVHSRVQSRRGTALSSLCNDMDEKRRIMLLDVPLELWSHRFDKKVLLFKRAGSGEGRNVWCIEPRVDQH